MTKVSVAADAEVEKLADLTTGYSVADLGNLVNEAALLASRRRGDDITMDDFTKAFEQCRPPRDAVVERLKQSRLSAAQYTLVEIIDTNLREITAPFLHSLSNLKVILTPQEIEVAGMVRSGRSSKEIAEVLNLSVSGVDFHRKSLRRKLGLTNDSTNLRSYLLSLE